MAHKLFAFTTGLLLAGCAANPRVSKAPAVSVAEAPAPAAPLSPRLPERLSFSIRHSLAGRVGDLSWQLSQRREPTGQILWTADGQGAGSFMGFGTKSRFSTVYDPGARLVSSWTLQRDTGRAVIHDEAAQSQPGVVTTHRQRSDKPEEWATLNAGTVTFDPFGFLLALRTHTQREPLSALVLEGRALWHVTAEAQAVEPITWAGQNVMALRYALKALPLDWERRPSKTRKARTLIVWLADGPERTPLAMKTSAPLGELRVELDEPAPTVAAR